jgi:hypothetical protein
MLIPDLRFLVLYCCSRLGIDARDERGMTTTEVAVITFLLVGAPSLSSGSSTPLPRAMPTTSRPLSSPPAEDHDSAA